MNLIIGKENTFDNETLIYENGDDVESIALIKSGSIRYEAGNGDTLTFEEGSFIALKDLFEKFYSGDYYALAGCRIMVFPADSIYAFADFMETSPEIHKMYHCEICAVLEFLYNHYATLYNEISDIYNSIMTAHNRYLQCCENAGVNPSKFLIPHSASLYKFENQSFAQNYSVFLSLSKNIAKLNMVYEKNPGSFLRQQINMINSIYTTYEDMIFYLKTEISLLVSRSQDCLFYLVSNLAEQSASSCRGEIMSLLTDMKNIVTNLDSHIAETTGIILDIDYSRVNFYFSIAENIASKPDEPVPSKTPEPVTVSSDNEKHIDFSATLLTLCKYAQVDKDFYTALSRLIDTYMSMSDKASRDDEARMFRRDIANMYFELYEKVFFRYADDKSPLPVIKLFLDYGLLDERLLTDEHLAVLADMKPLNDGSPCRVYRMSDWLMAIYRGQKMPSKNEFDKDYVEFIRDKKREEHLSPIEENKLLNDSAGKVRFEIRNLLKYNCRILNGNMLAFTPMLSSFDFEGDLRNFILTSEILNDAVNNCLSIDFSAFYREQMYAKPELKIEKEVIQLEVFPDIILFPVYGINSVMWQDLSGKRSNTPGRFLFPSFYRGNINDAMITVIGRFRWELCKSIMGTAWNNVIVPSLTSEYSDYVQFYRKNRDLSAEKKEALKNQISRCRNNMREVFISDYVTWIKYESAGAVRLNKVSRQILAMYCPFAKPLRDKLAGQPMYEDAMKRFNIFNQKKLHEMQTRLRALERNGATITKEILDTQHYYTL